MALTFRTGSDGIGRALTIDELDNNFRYFTGSHSITGSLTISGSCDITGSLVVSGSITTTEDVNLTGSFTGSFDGELNGRLTGSGTGSWDGDIVGSLSGSFTGSWDGYNSGSCLIGCTSSAVPTGARPEGTFEFVEDNGDHFIYVYLRGAWRSGSLS